MISTHCQNSLFGSRRYQGPSIVLCVLWSALSWACASHRDIEPEDKQPSKAGAAAPRSSSAQAETPAAPSGSVSAAPVPCGSMQCPPPTSLVAMAVGGPVSVACCVDPAAGECGTAAAPGSPCEPTPTPDERCPGVDLSALQSFVDLNSAPIGNTKVGCCTPKGQCGSDATAFGRGCIENAEASVLMASVPFVGSLISIPPARSCEEASASGK